MTVGILTFHNTLNYGATLQCYALVRVIRSFGVPVEVINYCPRSVLWLNLRHVVFTKDLRLANFEKTKNFWQFVRSELPLSGPPVMGARALAALADRYKLIVAGSDEVWKVGKYRPFDPAYYLGFADAARTRLASYAASAPRSADLDRHRADIQPLLSRFHGISVRDPWTAEFVAAVTGRSPPQVVDPTLLLAFDDLHLPRVHERPYLLLYAGLHAGNLGAAREFAVRHGLDLVSVGYSYPLARRNFRQAGPREWLSLIRHSDAVITNFFHGIIFAILFRKPAFGFIDKVKEEKLRNIFGFFGVSRNLYRNIEALDDLSLDDIQIDHNEVEKVVRPQRLQSLRFIESQLRDGGLISHRPTAEAAPAE